MTSYISWELEVISTWNFHKFTDDVIFNFGIRFNFIPCLDYMCTPPGAALGGKAASGILFVCRILDIMKGNMIKL